MQDEQAAAQDIDLGAEEAPEAPDPFAETAADPDASLGGTDEEPAPAVEDVSAAPEEERLGGEGETLEEPPPEEVLADPEEDEPEEEPVAEPEPAAPDPEEVSEEPQGAEPEPQEEQPAAEEPEPPKPAKAPKKRATKKGTAGSPSRTYKILLYDKEADAWVVPKEIADGQEAKNTEQALRAAYNTLEPKGDKTLTIAAVPDNYWKPKPVKAKVREDRAIQVG